MGGALIAPDIVLTAGHCLPKPDQKVTLKVGTYSISRDGSDSEELAIVRAVRHPNWREIAFENFSSDFLIFQLSGKATRHPVVKINRDPTVPAKKQEIIMMGLGWTNKTAQSPADTLQVASLNAISGNQCARSYDPSRNITYSDRIDETMICTTGGPNNERDGW